MQSKLCLIALCLPLHAQDNKVKSGTINGANFRIEIPAN
jgi:hypothetical protein